jgi:hypothetical protein
MLSCCDAAYTERESDDGRKLQRGSFPTRHHSHGYPLYVAYPLSTRHVEELMEERGVAVDHSTINRWVIKYRPFRPFSKRFVRNGAKPGIHSRREAQQLQNSLLQGTQSRQMAIHAVDPLNHRQRHLLKRFE